VIHGSSSVTVAKTAHGVELQGKLRSEFDEDRLMHLVLDNDKETLTQGLILKQALNHGHRCFTPSQLLETLITDYRTAEKLYGKTLLRLATGYSAEYLRKNIKIPEFRKKVSNDVEQIQKRLEDRGLIDGEGRISDLGIELASLLLYIEELERLVPKRGLGGKLTKIRNTFGEREARIEFRKGLPYRNLDTRGTVKRAARRLHRSFLKQDLVAFDRKQRGLKWVVFVLDSSGSMQDTKIDYAKKAGIALAYRAIEEGNRIGLVVFSSKVLVEEAPTRDLKRILKAITVVSPKRETDIASAIRAAVKLFPRGKHTKHMIIITDALPTHGKQPEEETLKEVGIATAQGVSISLVGIQLNQKGERLAKRITELGEGRLYVVKELSNLDRVVLTDYYAVE